MIMFVFTQVVRVGCDWWVAKWALGEYGLSKADYLYSK